LAGTQLITYPIAPILSLGDATLDVRTAGDLRLQTFLDPLLVGKGTLYEPTFMSSQTERTALSLTSTGGDVILVGQATYLSKDVTTVSEQQAYGNVNLFAGNIYPSKTRVTALNGSVVNSVSLMHGTIALSGTLYKMPSSHPELRILAANDVLSGEIVMARATLEMIPSPFEPVAGSLSSRLTWATELGSTESWSTLSPRRPITSPAMRCTFTIFAILRICRTRTTTNRAASTR
jgi:hypothetical protein